MGKMIETADPVWERLSRDLKKASALLSRDEARFLVDYYYTVQDNRIRLDNQIRALDKSEEPHALLDWMLRNANATERDVKLALDVYSANHTAGQWARNQVGVGPVLAAGLLAHIDPEKATTAGKVWRFAGLDPTSKWGKGEKRPWNAALKVLCWKLGVSFMKTHNRDGAYYGQAYKRRKELEIARNEAGDNAEWAAHILEEKNWKKDNITRRAYESGKLPAAQVDARARRWAVKLFLSHFQQVLFESTFKKQAPKPWIIAFGGHVDYLEPPGWAPLLGSSIEKA